MDYNHKVIKVLDIISNSEAKSHRTGYILLRSDDVLLEGSTYEESVNYMELKSILQKIAFERDVIDVIDAFESKNSKHEHNVTETAYLYHIKKLHKFNEYHSKFLAQHSDNPGEAAHTITYSEHDREIVLDDKYVLSRPNCNGINELVFTYLFNNPNRFISLDELEKKATREPINKSLHEIFKELRLKNDLRKVFLSISKSGVTFRNPVTKSDLKALGISKLRI